MSELTWYSRLLVWVGAVILIVESAAGRTLGLATVIGVLALAGGLIVFVAGLALDGRPIRLPLVEDDENFADGEDDAPETRVAAEPLVPVHMPTIEQPVEAEPGQAAENLATENLPAATTASRRGALGIDIEPESALVGTVCVACHEPLQSGQVAAECRECSTTQHAACWVGNHFHCGRDGCGGQGPLEAPVAQEDTVGPSTA